MGSNQSTRRQSALTDHAPVHKVAQFVAQDVEELKRAVDAFINFARPGDTYRLNWSQLTREDRTKLLAWIATLEGTSFRNSYLTNVTATDPAKKGALIGAGVGVAAGIAVAATLIMTGVMAPIAGILLGGLLFVGCTGAGYAIGRNYGWVTVETSGAEIKFTKTEAAERA